MPKNKIAAAIVAATLVTLSATAQVADQPNIGKVNILGLGVRTLSVQYERALPGKFSFAGSMNIRPGGPVPMRGLFRGYSGAYDSVYNTVLDNSRLSHFSLTPEVRYYFGKRPMSGFYTALYGRFASSTYSASYTHVKDGKEYPVTASARGTSVGAGLLFGAQFPLSDRVVLDWWIAGASINRTSFVVKGRADLTEVGQEDRAAAEEALEDDDVFNGAFDVSIHDNGGIARGALTTPGLRTGLCIGLRF